MSAACVQVQSDWCQGGLDIVVATVAFGESCWESGQLLLLLPISNEPHTKRMWQSLLATVPLVCVSAAAAWLAAGMGIDRADVRCAHGAVTPQPLSSCCQQHMPGCTAQQLHSAALTDCRVAQLTLETCRDVCTDTYACM